MLILDGVYTPEQNGPRFHGVGAPDAQTLERLLNRLIRRILRRLMGDGLLVADPEQPWLDLEPADTLDHLNVASIRYRIAVGNGAGSRTLTLKNPALARTDSTPKPFTANRDGFSLNCAVACQPHQRDRLERLCRYITRPALCLERLSTNAAGQVVYQLKNPYRDGTTHVLFSPEDFIARLAALVPRPRINLTRYHGLFAPSSPMRRAIVPTPAKLRQRRKPEDPATAPAAQHNKPSEPPTGRAPPTAPLTWAQRLKRVFEIDITLCPLCGGQLRVIADITDPELIGKILDHVHSRAPPRLPPARAEPRTTPLDLFGEP